MSVDDQKTSTESDVQTIRGCKFPLHPLFPKEKIEAALDYVPHDGDIVIASYPKTGTTWMQYIVLQIISRGENFPDFDDLQFKIAPFMEVAGIEAIEKLQPPRVYKHHCPYNLVKKNTYAKTLYTYRKPEDTFVSFYHFSRGFKAQPVSFDVLIENFITGEIGYGRYFEHVLTFLAHKNDPNLLMVSYEKLHSNRKEEILKIAKFLGEEYYESLINDDNLFKRILEHTSFEYMKKHLHMGMKIDDAKTDSPQNKVQFFRKGTVGDGKNYLSEGQLHRLRTVGMEVVRGTQLEEEWYKDSKTG